MGEKTKGEKPHVSEAVVVAGYGGLTSAEVEESRQKHGGNVMTPPKRDPWWRQFLEKFDDPVIRILLVAAIVSLAAGAVEGHYVESLGIFVAVFLATFIAFINEFRAAAEFDILNKVNDEVPVNVVRDGIYTTSGRRDIVVGDLVLVETGDEIPADGELIEATSLQIDESMLTGESVAVNKIVRAPDETAEVALFAKFAVMRSTLVADGTGAVRVTAVGDHTEIGQTARAAAEDTGEVTPLNRQLNRLAQLIGVLGFGIAGVTFLALLVRGLLTGDYSLNPERAWFTLAIGLGLAIMSQKVWVPIVMDARDLLGKRAETPSWLDGGGVVGWLKIMGAGVILAGALLGVFMATGLVSTTPGQWIETAELTTLLGYFMIAVTIVVVAVPEGLAMSVTLSLAYSMRKMTASNNLVRRMHACETIGAATVICSDKTGTLTQNRMRVSEAHLSHLEGDDVDPKDLAEYLENTEFGVLIADGISVNSTANLEELEDSEEPRVLGNPTEGALLIWLNQLGVSYLAHRNAFKVERRWGFDTRRKFMATVGGDDRHMHVKGAPEIILERCENYLKPDGTTAPLDEDHIEEIREDLVKLQSRGMRTLAFAHRDLEDGDELPEDALDACVDLIWLGFFAIADPVREDVPDAIKTAAKAGIAVKIVTGDIAATAKEIGRQIHIITGAENELVLEGKEFEAMSDEEIKSKLDDIKVLARARPKDKLRLVRLLQENNEVVAVTGDGTNDAPALNYADVGLAMGQCGTSVAKEAADIVLLDDSFPSIINAVKWGRSLYLNIQRFILFQLTINVAACIIAMLGPFIGVELPLTVIQMLWVNLIMDTFAALALATEPPSDDVLSDAPRDPTAFIISKTMAQNILTTGGIFIVVLITLLKTNFFGSSYAGTCPDWVAAGECYDMHNLSLFFNFFVMLQFWNMFNARTLGSNRSGLAGLGENRAFLVIAAAIFFGQIFIMQFGGEPFRVTPLSLNEWLVTTGTASLVLIIGEFIRWRKRSQSAGAPALATG